VSVGAIVVQTFVKLDTLSLLCDSLLRCGGRSNFDLIFWSDDARGSRKAAENSAKSEKVRRHVNEFSVACAGEFGSIVNHKNPSNLGTCKTCEVALNYAFANHKFVIFTEDDTIFARDALQWFLAMRETPEFLSPATWAIAGESVFFDAKQRAFGQELVIDARLHAKRRGLWNKFVAERFLPSTCFATTRNKWAEFSATRGQPLGDVDVCNRCAAEEKRCLFPVVGRVKDIGMLHPDGYSILIHSEKKVQQNDKNCYLLSDEICPDDAAVLIPEKFNGDRNLLYWQSVLLNGFKEGDAGGTSRAAVPQQETPGGNSLSPVDLLQAARAASQAEDWPKALELWDRLAQHSADRVEIGSYRALCRLKLGHAKAALVIIEDVLVVSPEDGFAASIKAYASEACGEYEAAANIWLSLTQRADIPAWLRRNAESGVSRCCDGSPNEL